MNLGVGASSKGLFRSTASNGRAFAAHRKRRKSFSASDIWHFAGRLADGHSPDNAAKWAGRKASDGAAMLEALCRKMGKQAC